MEKAIIHHPYWQTDGLLRSVMLRQTFVYMLGNLHAAILLSQIVYWFKPSKTGKLKVTVKKDGKLWIAKSREGWMDETGLSLDLFKSSIQKLKDRHLITYRRHGFGGKVTPHIHLHLDQLDTGLKKWVCLNKQFDAIGIKQEAFDGSSTAEHWGDEHHSLGGEDSNGLVSIKPLPLDHWCQIHQSNKDTLFEEVKEEDYINGKANSTYVHTLTSTLPISKDKSNPNSKNKPLGVHEKPKNESADQAKDDSSNLTSPNAPIAYWEMQMDTVFPEEKYRLDAKERMLLLKLIAQLSESHPSLEWKHWINYVIHHWDHYASFIFKKSGWNKCDKKRRVVFCYVHRQFLPEYLELASSQKSQEQTVEEMLEESDKVKAEELGMTLEEFKEKYGD